MAGTSGAHEVVEPDPADLVGVAGHRDHAGRRPHEPAWASAGSRPRVRAMWPRWLVPSCISNPSAVSRRGMAITPALLTSRSSGSAGPPLGAGAHRGEVGEVERDDGHVPAPRARRRPRSWPGPSSPRPASRTPRGTSAPCRASSRAVHEADAGVGAGHEGAAAGEVGDVGGGPGAHGPILTRRRRGARPGRRRAAARFGGTRPLGILLWLYAPLAQSAERLHGKEKVYGSIP